MRKSILFLALGLLMAVGAWAQQYKVYSVFNESNSTLTFYHDDMMKSREGFVRELSPDDVSSSILNEYVSYSNSKVLKAVIDNSMQDAGLTSTASMFNGFTNMTAIEGMKNLVTDEVTNMTSMFRDCHSLKSLDLSHFNTENVKKMVSMFEECKSLETLDLSYFNTPNLEKTGYMFAKCMKLKSVDVTTLDVSKVTSMNSMFMGCCALEELDLTSFDVSSCMDFCYMFMGCKSLKFIYSNTNWFKYRNPKFDKVECHYSHLVEICEYPYQRHLGMFRGIGWDDWGEGIQYAYPKGDDDDDDEGPNGNFTPKPIAYTLYQNGRLSYMYDIYYMAYRREGKIVERYSPNIHRFKGYAQEVETIGISKNFLNAQLTTTRNMFFGGIEDEDHMLSNATKIVGLQYLNTENVTDMRNMFRGCQSLRELPGLDHFTTPNLANMNNMFNGCKKLETVDIGSFDTRNVTSVANLFKNCQSLQTIYCPDDWSDRQFNSSTSSLFKGCSKLKGQAGTQCDGSSQIDQTYAHVDGGTTYPGYFADNQKCYTVYDADNGTLTYYYDARCNARSGVVELYDPDESTSSARFIGYNQAVSQIIIDPSMKNAGKNLKSFAHLFYGRNRRLQNVTSIKGLENLSTADVTSLKEMFYGCMSLEELDLTGFDMSKVTDVTDMFSGCQSLTTIYCNDVWRVKTSTGLFDDCYSLVGGRNTDYNDGKTYTISYAHPDGGTAAPGFFTAADELYSVFDENLSTLTYYYDGNRLNATGVAERYDPSVTRFKEYSNKIKRVIIQPAVKNAQLTDLSYFFCSHDFETNITYPMTMTEIIGLEYLHTENVTDMSYMFDGCTKLTSLDVSSFNMDNVTNTACMFRDCSSLKTIYSDKSWNGSVRETVSTDMFAGCTSLVGGMGYKYDASNTDLSYAAIDFEDRFHAYFTRKPEVYTVFEDGVLTFFYNGQREYYEWMHSDAKVAPYDPEAEDRFPGIGISNNVKKVVIDPSMKETALPTLRGFFSNMFVLETIEGMGNLRTSGATDLSGMFRYCQVLREVDLSTFYILSVTDMSEMFYGCYRLTTIWCNQDWTAGTVQNSENMFSGCWSLVGSQGTSYDESKTDLSYARTDGYEDKKGYFSAKKEIYTVWIPSNKQLVYRYDENRIYTKNAELYDPINEPNALRFVGYNDEVEEAVIYPSMAEAPLTSLRSMFYGGLEDGSAYPLYNLKRIWWLKNLHTENVTDMSYMFAGCQSLEEVNVNTFRIDNLENTSYMFYGCLKLKTIVCNIDWTKNETVHNSEEMFHYCYALKGDMGTTYSVSNAHDITYALGDGLGGKNGYFFKELEIYTIFTEKDSTLTYYCDKWRSNREGVFEFYNTDDPDAERFLGYSNKVKTIVVDPSMTYPFRTMRSMFRGGYNSALSHATQIIGLENLNTTYVTDMSRMFWGCASLTYLDLSTWDISSLDKTEEMFFYCANLKTINCSTNWNKSSISANDSKDMFIGCSKLVGSNGTTYNPSNVNISYAVVDQSNNPGYFSKLEWYYTYKDGVLTYYYDSNRSKRTGATLFVQEEILQLPDEIRYNATRVRLDQSMQYNRPLSAEKIFMGLESITTIEGLQYLNTSRMTSMQGMFLGCIELTELDVSNFQTQNVTDMSYMFGGCYALKKITGLGSFNTEKVENMDGMFWYDCALKELDLTSFDVSNVQNTHEMFYSCYELTTIYANKDWTKGNITQSDDMFKVCLKLQGGWGSMYNKSNENNISYARPDGGTAAPGYFSSRPEVYSAYKDYTLTYYYDAKRIMREQEGYTTDLYGPDIEKAEASYIASNTYKAIIDPSMAKAPLTSTRRMFYFEKDGVPYNLDQMYIIEGLEYLNTSEVEDMSEMFRGCHKLEKLDIRTFNVSKVHNVQRMFDGCTSLTTIVCNDDWSQYENLQNSATHSQLFRDCNNLTGSMGSTPEPGISYGIKLARPDESALHPGFFTALYKLNLEADNGSVGIYEEVDTDNILGGTEVTLRAMPQAGYELDHWEKYNPASGAVEIQPAKRHDAPKQANGLSAETDAQEKGLVILSDLIVRAVMRAQTFTVTFYDWNMNVLKEETVAYGGSVTAPNDPIRNEYVFEGWSTDDLTNITSDLDIYAIYKDIHEGIESIEAPTDNAQKIMIDGQLYIATPDGKIFNTQGARVK